MRLTHWLALYDVPQAAFAAAIKVHPTTVGKYLSGEILPGKDIMRRIYIVTGGLVAPNDFYDLSLDNLTEEEKTYGLTTFRPRGGLTAYSAA